MSPYVLRVLVHQNHAFGIDYNQKSFDQRIKHLLDKTNLQASTKYPLQSEEGTEPSKTQVFHNKHTDIENYIKTFKGKEEYVKIFTSVNIEALLRRFREKYRIIGSNCKAKGNTVSSFQVEQNGTIFDICLATKQTGGQLDLSFKDADVYHHFSEAYAKINRALLTKYLSKYNKQYYDIMSKYLRGPISGTFVTDDPEYFERNAPSSDMNKAFTARIIQPSYYPVGNQFSIFRPYKGDPINN
jgi:ribosome-associated translation inhibitor RaiA